MKKQPIDDLFAKKLTNWEPKVSPDLWARIEAKQEKKTRRLGGWLWSVAASLTLLLTTGYLLWQNQPLIPMGSETGIVQTEIEGPKAVLTEPKTEFATPATASGEATTNREAKQTKPQIKDAQRYTAAPKPATSAENLAEKAQPKNRDQMEIATIERKAVDSKSMGDQIVEPPLSQTIEVLAVAPEVATVTENRVIRANIDWDESAKEEARKDSRFGKIMQQLKNAKQGEAVDWTEVGFNPKKILARADEKIKNEEDKVSKKYQEFKDKTKL